MEVPAVGELQRLSGECAILRQENARLQEELATFRHFAEMVRVAQLRLPSDALTAIAV